MLQPETQPFVGDPVRLADVQRIAAHRRDDDVRVGGRVEVLGDVAGELDRGRDRRPASAVRAGPATQDSTGTNGGAP